MSEERDYETEAKADGWAPKDSWKGDPELWKTAEQFVSDGENINGYLRKKVERLETRVNEVVSSNKSLNEMSQRSLAKEKQATAEAIAELEALRTKAVDESDGEAFQRADSQIQELREPPQAQQSSQAAENWLQGNQWYSTNATLAIYADGLADRLRAQGYNDQSPAYFAELTKQVQETFPDDFGNKNRKRPTGVEAGGQVEVKSEEQSFDNLPKEAKLAYAQFAKDIPDFTKEQYVETYDWSQDNV